MTPCNRCFPIIKGIFMRFCILLFVLMFSLLSQPLTFHISSDVHDTNTVKFIPHSGPGAFDNYLIQNVPFTPVKQLYLSLQEKLQQSLTNRGEAHITVITPPEYHNSLRSFVSMREIDKIAIDMNIQKCKFEIICLGRGTKKIDDKEEHTYFVVVKSSQLLAIRKKIWELYVAKGGEADKFDYKHYYPHITLGFTKRDLHESDGIIKDKSAFFAHLSDKPTKTKYTMTSRNLKSILPTSSNHQKIRPFLMFEGQAEEAMNFYTSIFPNSRIIDISRYGANESGIEGSVLMGSISLKGQTIIFIDSSVKHNSSFTPRMSLHVMCDGEEELQNIFAKLSEGGEVLVGLGEYPFAKKYVWFNDKYGVSWQLMFEGE